MLAFAFNGVDGGGLGIRLDMDTSMQAHVCQADLGRRYPYSALSDRNLFLPTVRPRVLTDLHQSSYHAVAVRERKAFTQGHLLRHSPKPEADFDARELMPTPKNKQICWLLPSHGDCKYRIYVPDLTMHDEENDEDVIGHYFHPSPESPILRPGFMEKMQRLFAKGRMNVTQ